jgi:DNA ligase-1
VHRLDPLVEDHPAVRDVPGVLQGQRADVALARQQALDPVRPGRDQPALELAQHRAADAAVPPCRGQADPHHPGPVGGHGGDRGSDQLLADDRHDRGLMGTDGGDQVGQPEDGRPAAGRRVVPQPDGRVEIVGVEVTYSPHRHGLSVSSGCGPRCHLAGARAALSACHEANRERKQVVHESRATRPGNARRVMIGKGERSAVKYEIVAEAYRDLEQVSGRLALIERLAALVSQTPGALLPVVCYLCQGLIAPEFAGVDLGMAEKMAVRAVATATRTGPEQVVALVRETGDLGQAGEQLLAATAAERPAVLTVTTVVNTLRQIANAEGQGSQGRKLELLAGLLDQATPLEARYLLRLVTGSLRLGVGTPTILDALAQVYAGGRAGRPVLERAYSICCDLGQVASALVSGGLAAVEQIQVRPGNPVRVMLAQRLSDAGEILAKLGGDCAAEYKYDGVRVQAHRTADGTIELFTRRLEEISTQFPDVVELLAAGLEPREAILEGEVVAYDAAAGELRPFQEVMFRRRKYGIAEAMRDVPVGLFCFELLYADGEDLTRQPYPRRRAALAEAITVSSQLRLTTAVEVSTPEALDAAFEQAVTDGCEGLMCKSVSPASVYQAGARGWLWIKLKRDYRTELSDTVDLVVVGAYAGRGRRAGVYGALLLAAYDADADVFRTVSKCGTGFSDADLASLPARLAPLASPHQPARVDARQEPDAWFEPGLVLEILSAELTLSPNYTAGWGQIKEDAGLAMRFPRFTGRWRDDKSAEDATTTTELAELYRTARRAPAGT